MFLMIDNYDSFTYNLVQYFQMLGETVDVFRNDDPLDIIDMDSYQGIILSPGPSHPSSAGISLEIIRRHINIPMLGVCLGMQVMAHALGGEIVRSSRIMHGKVDTIRHNGGELFRNIPEEFNAVRYHSLVASIESLPECLDAAGFSSDGEIMAIKHRDHFIWGVQFHPESYLTEYGLTIIKNFIGGSYEHSKLN